MRSVMPQPCIGSSCSALSTSMSSVPGRRSLRSFVTRFLSTIERRIANGPFDCQREGWTSALGPLGGRGCIQISRLLHAHEIVLKEARTMARRAAEGGDDGMNDLLVSDVIRSNELQVWFVA